MALKWILERDMFPDNHDRLAGAIKNMGQQVITWNDDWWETSKVSDYKSIIFHGCLENAARIQNETNWKPGAYCNIDTFKCSSWYPNAEPWILNSKWALTSVSDFVENPQKILDQIDVEDRFFVRPNSPLKPFSGRLLTIKSLSLKALDHGFYYDEKSLDIVVAPVQNISDEWRYIIVGKNIVAGSSYIAETHTEISADPRGNQWQYAQEIARNLEPPEDVYVMDICLTENDLKLLELNPFSGADLYACDRDSIVQSITNIIEG